MSANIPVTFSPSDSIEELAAKLNKMKLILQRTGVGGQNTITINQISAAGGGSGVSLVTTSGAKKIAVLAGATQFVSFTQPFTTDFVFFWRSYDSGNRVVDLDVAVDPAGTGFTISNAIVNCTLVYHAKAVD